MFPESISIGVDNMKTLRKTINVDAHDVSKTNK